MGFLTSLVSLLATLAVGAILLRPFRMKARRRDVRCDVHVAVYRDELNAIQREFETGLFTADQVEFARAEIGRRLLDANCNPSPPPLSKGKGHPLTEVFVAAVFAAAFATLIAGGGVRHLIATSEGWQAGVSMTERIAFDERAIALNHDAGKSWDELAPIYYRQERYKQAETAFRNSIRLLGPSSLRLDGLAETLMAQDGGAIKYDAAKLFDQSLSIDPSNPRTRFYIALSLEQSGQPVEARLAFENLARESPADASWLPMVNEHIAKNGGTVSASAPRPVGSGGPTADDVAAAQNMYPGDRQQMIRGMVESLDAKLSSDPDNLEGWIRLVRSYVGLNEKDRAAGALKRGLTAFPSSGEQGRQLVALGKELGIATEGMTE